MPVPNIVIDGAMAYGSTAVTIDSQSYIVNSWSVDRPVDEVVDKGSTGLPVRARATAQQAGFNAELQLESGSTPFPQLGDTFTYTCDSNYGSETWVVHTVVPNISNDSGAIRTITVTGKKVLSGITTV